MVITARCAIQRYAVYFLAWTLAGIFYLSQDVTRRYFLHDPMPWREVSYWMVRVYISAACTPAILWLGRRWPIERHKWFSRSALHLLFSVCFSVGQVALQTGVLLRVGDLSALSLVDSFRQSLLILLIFTFHGNVIAYWAVLGIQSGFHYYRRYRDREQQALRLELHASELKAQLVHAELSALKMQLQPHFLFNTLNAIVVLVRQQKGRLAEEMLARLSDLLRAVLSDMDAQEVPLSRELQYLRLYLSIEQVRFADRLRVEISADPAILHAAVPHLGLQPIVENAVRHGIGKSAAAGSIEIRASRVNDTLVITVKDDGPGLSPVDLSQGWGIGVSNTRARLHQLYGEAASLTIASGDAGGAVVTVVLPYRIAQEVSEVFARD